MASANVDLPEDIDLIGIPIFHMSLASELAEAERFETAHAFNKFVNPQRPAVDGSWCKTSSRASEFPELVLVNELLNEEGEEDATDCEGGD